MDSLVSLNFVTGEVEEVIPYPGHFTRQPLFFELTFDQRICMISSNYNCIHINFETNKIKDMDKYLGVSEIKVVKYDREDGVFFMVSNKLKDVLGFYVQRINA